MNADAVQKSVSNYAKIKYKDKILENIRMRSGILSKTKFFYCNKFKSMINPQM